ncbi:hypothetical protein [Novosphingobium sp.]|uniref:hypothetical protein n=1 Tax=Novosphingobium sp. TaxID=1874826 RepID=UPI00352A6A9D
MTEKLDRLFSRAEAILAGKANGFGIPILRTLAHRQYGPAMLMLAALQTDSGTRGEFGRFCNANDPAGLMYRAFRKGEVNAAQNLALTLFYLGDLAGYRRWLRQAARGSDEDAARELSRFEVRQPWPLAQKTKRKRPFRKDGS